MGQDSQRNGWRDKFADLVPSLIVKERDVKSVTSYFKIDEAFVDEAVHLFSFLSCFTLILILSVPDVTDRLRHAIQFFDPLFLSFDLIWRDISLLVLPNALPWL